ncbi:MAG: hypothetical protein BWY98_00845 [Tenericutes bacterium ADurb.BinA155]|nr:MAG: hypothetical protein BWY98_00845 [Tenericutes bacterium ADurb.BinA155]
MNVAGEQNLFAGFDRGEEHRDDAAAGSIDKKEGFIGSTGIGKELFRFKNDAMGLCEVVESDWGIHIEVIDGVAKQVGRGVLDVTHVMSRDIKRHNVCRSIFTKGINERRLSLIQFVHNFARPSVHAYARACNVKESP